jgi:hypothetical protein
MTGILRDALDRDEPFTVLWDLRAMRPPSRAALKYGVDWMGLPRNVEAIDALVEGTVIIAGSAIVRTLCRWVLHVCQPPQPVRICRDEAAALTAAKELH